MILFYFFYNVTMVLHRKHLEPSCGLCGPLAGIFESWLTVLNQESDYSWFSIVMSFPKVEYNEIVRSDCHQS